MIALILLGGKSAIGVMPEPVPVRVEPPNGPRPRRRPLRYPDSFDEPPRRPDDPSTVLDPADDASLDAAIELARRLAEERGRQRGRDATAGPESDPSAGIEAAFGGEE